MEDKIIYTLKLIGKFLIAMTVGVILMSKLVNINPIELAGSTLNYIKIFLGLGN